MDETPAADARAAGLRYVSDAMPGLRRKRSGKRFSYLDALRLLSAGRQEEAARAFAQIRADEPDHAGAALNEARALLASDEAGPALEASTHACRSARPSPLRRPGPSLQLSLSSRLSDQPFPDRP